MSRTTTMLGIVMEKSARAHHDLGAPPRFLLIGKASFMRLANSEDFLAIMRVIGTPDLTPEVVAAVCGLEVVIDADNPNRLDVVSDVAREVWK